VTKDFPIPPKEFKVDQDIPSVETVADRWITEDTDSFYYNINDVKDVKDTNDIKDT
jgi:hypothetical protein